MKIHVSFFKSRPEFPASVQVMEMPARQPLMEWTSELEGNG